jgi:hypothetical protein
MLERLLNPLECWVELTAGWLLQCFEVIALSLPFEVFEVLREGDYFTPGIY